jgi:Putative Ig domain
MTNTRRSPATMLTITLMVSLSTLAGCKSGGGSPDSPTAPATVPVNTQLGSPTPQPAASSTNTAPTIGGSATRSIATNSLYSFAPSAHDADADQVTFQIQNKPSWATFSTVTGQLTGTPTQAGVFANVVITATDGKASAALAPFSITVTAGAQATAGSATLQWEAPSQNTDGSSLTNLAGFVIVYGNSSTALTRSVRIANASVDRYIFEALPAGTYYFGIKAYTSAGVESAVSRIASKRIG